MGYANRCNFCGELDALFDSEDINLGWLCRECLEEHEKEGII